MITFVPQVAPLAPLQCFMMALTVPMISIADMIQNYSDKTTRLWRATDLTAQPQVKSNFDILQNVPKSASTRMSTEKDPTDPILLYETFWSPLTARNMIFEGTEKFSLHVRPWFPNDLYLVIQWSLLHLAKTCRHSSVTMTPLGTGKSVTERSCHSNRSHFDIFVRPIGDCQNCHCSRLSLKALSL